MSYYEDGIRYKNMKKKSIKVVAIKTGLYHPYRIILYIILVESNILYKTSFYILITKREF